MDQAITLEHFFKLLHDSVNDGFSVRYRRKEDGAVGERHGCRKSRKKMTGKGGQPGAVKLPGLRYDLLEKGMVLLEDEQGKFFALRNRLIMGYRFAGQNDWYRIKHSW